MQSKPKPSIGVTFHPTFPPETLANFASQAEAAGFDEVWLWEDCFYAGAFTSAATILSATQSVKVGIGILPVTVRNPLFTAMEITTLARLYPGRFIPGFGHGVESWMKQIGSYPKSTLSALEETVSVVRRLLLGENTTMHGEHVFLDNVQMKLTPKEMPPLFIGGIREKTLRLAGRVGDGTILTSMSSPAYIHWADTHIRTGMNEAGRTENHRTVSVFCKVNPDGASARDVARQTLAKIFENGEPHLFALGIDEEAPGLVKKYGIEGAAKRMPDAWVDALSASGTPDHAVESINNLIQAGADTIILEPIEGDPASLHDYIRYLLPSLQK